MTHVALCRLEETQTNNKILNRAPRGIRSRTHTVYHADADCDDSFLRELELPLVVKITDSNVI